VSAAREVFALIATALETGNIDDQLECDSAVDSFRRLVS